MISDSMAVFSLTGVGVHNKRSRTIVEERRGSKPRNEKRLPVGSLENVAVRLLRECLSVSAWA